MAHLVLEAHNIPSAIMRDTAGGMIPSMALLYPVRLAVRREDADEARKILDAEAPLQSEDGAGETVEQPIGSLSGGEAFIVPGPDPSRPLNNVVFQEYAVFPWKTVRDNVAFGLQMRGVGRGERLAVADRWLAKVGLKRFADYYPAQISGGMKQRVSIARALANDPQVLLMDEPLGALDAQTRAVLQEELLRLWEETHKTVLYVTHSIEEAVLLGDRVVLMTAHPGTKKAEFVVDLPRPRDLGTTQSRRFAELTGAIWDELKDEVRRAMEAQA